MSEKIIVNLIDPAIAQMTKTYLSRHYPNYVFKVAKYYSEYHHVVTHHELSKEQLEEIQAYAQGVSDVLRKLIE